MLTDVFYWIVNMSAAGTIVGLFVLLLRLIRPLPRRFIFLLWGIPLLRLWIPVSVGGEYSLMALLGEVMTKTVVVYERFDSIVTAMNFVQFADQYFPVVIKTSPLSGIFEICSIVWLTVTAGLLGAYGVLYLAGKREVRDAVKLRDNLYLSPALRSPAVYGIFRPKIVLSHVSQDNELILRHETAHIRRGDNFWRLLAMATAAVHWFNPAVWIFLKCFLNDLELACDENVLKKCTPAEQKAYASALLDCHESRTITASAFGGAGLRRRIENILSYRYMTGFSVLCLAVLAYVAAYVLLTNPV